MKKILFLYRLFYVFIVIGLCLTMLICSSCSNNFILQNPDGNLIVDQIGREENIKNPISRISSGYYITTSAMVALGQKNKLVTIDDKTSTIPLFKNCFKEIIGLPTCGNSTQFNLETAFANKAEMVVIPTGLINYIEKFNQVNLTSIVVKPEDQESFYTMINILGQACNCSEESKELVHYIEQQNNDLNSMLIIDDRPSIYFASNSNILYGAVPSSFQNQIIEQSGCLNILNDVENSNIWAEIGYENLIIKNPDYIILPSNCSYTIDDVLNDEKLATCKAVLNKNVYKMPNSIEYWDSPVPGAFLGAYWLSSIVYPNQIPNSEYKNRAIEFYKKFYNVNIEPLI